jgi:hypothetical protein
VTRRGSNPRRANGSRRDKLRARLRAEGRPCHICGMPIDYALPPGHPMSFEVDELVPVRHDGDPLDYGNVDAAHRYCNRQRAVIEMRDERRGRAPSPRRGLFPPSGDL